MTSLHGLLVCALTLGVLCCTGGDGGAPLPDGGLRPDAREAEDVEGGPLLPASMEGVTLIVADEFDPYPLVMESLETLSLYPEVALCLAVREGAWPDEELSDLIRRSAHLGVPFMAWLLLDESKGYWFNEENFHLAEATTREFMDWVEGEGLPLEWILFDMELHLDKIRELEEASVSELVALLRENLDEDAYALSTARYAGLVEEAQGRGYSVTAAAYPFVLDDLQDGDNQIQDGFNTPIVGVPFDEIYFMAYRTTFESMLGMEAGADLIYSYGVDAMEHFGPSGLLALGIIGDIGQISDLGFTEASQLGEDVSAALAAGGRRTFVFSLDGMLSLPPLEPWLDLSRLEPLEPPQEGTASSIRDILSLLDSLL